MPRSRRSSPRPTTARNGIFHPATGETIAQGRYGLPVFLANMQFTVTEPDRARREARAASSRATCGSSTTRMSAARHLQESCWSSRRTSSTASCSRCWPTPATGWTSAAACPAAGRRKATEIHQEGIDHPAGEALRRRQAQRALVEDVHAPTCACPSRSPATSRRCATCSTSGGAASTRCSRATAARRSPTASTR